MLKLNVGCEIQINKAPAWKRVLFNTMFSIKSSFVNSGVCTLPVVDSLAFKAVQQRLGGRVRLVVSGGAPLANHVEHFLKVTLCCPVSQVQIFRHLLGAVSVGAPHPWTSSLCAARVPSVIIPRLSAASKAVLRCSFYNGR